MSRNSTGTASIQVDNVSMKFNISDYRVTGIKEALLRLIVKPEWYKKKVKGPTEYWALQKVNLNIQEGERVGIIGNNGAGKSTLLKIITRIYQPTSGKVKVLGRAASLIEVGTGFHPELTGRENIFLNGAILGIPKREMESRYDQIVAFSELAQFMDTPVKYYSTGMYLRLAFTIATEITPDILILDELYAGGDIGFVKQANDRLEKFIERSKVLILVAHQMEYIHRFCNRVIVLDKGEIRFSGTPAEGVERYSSFTAGDPKAFN